MLGPRSVQLFFRDPGEMSTEMETSQENQSSIINFKMRVHVQYNIIIYQKNMTMLLNTVFTHLF